MELENGLRLFLRSGARLWVPALYLNVFGNTRPRIQNVLKDILEKSLLSIPVSATQFLSWKQLILPDVG